MSMRRLWGTLGIGLLAFAMGATASAQPPIQQPWMDSSLSADARADLLQAQLSQDEQLLLL
jgi:hypothetical protein